jgi:hypothetical protein
VVIAGESAEAKPQLQVIYALKTGIKLQRPAPRLYSRDTHRIREKTRR